MAASIHTVLDEKNYPKFMQDQLKDVGAAARYAFSHDRINIKICEGIVADIAHDLGPHSDFGAYYRVETGFNAAAQYLGAIEDAATRTTLRYKNCLEQFELEQMRELKKGFLDMVQNRIVAMDRHFSTRGIPDGGATYQKIRDAYVPGLVASGVHIEKHIAGELEKVSREVKDSPPQRVPDKGSPA
jgi:hypothetical protein